MNALYHLFLWRENMHSKINETINSVERILKNSFWRKQQLSNLFTVFVFTAIFLSGLLSSKESFAGEAWVANMKGANVQIIDTGSNKVVKTIPTGAGAHNGTFSPDGKLAYIANLGTNSITIIDAVSKEKLADVLADTKAHDVAVSPDGKQPSPATLVQEILHLLTLRLKKPLTPWQPGKKPLPLYFLPMGKLCTWSTQVMQIFR